MTDLLVLDDDGQTFIPFDRWCAKTRQATVDGMLARLDAQHIPRNHPAVADGLLELNAKIDARFAQDRAELEARKARLLLH
jgi:hypothetical protein